MSNFSDILALINDILQAVIVIFGVGVILYNLPYVRDDRVLRAYSLLLGGVILVYFTELLVSRVSLPGSAETWLYVKWLGITFVPAIQFQFSDTLLNTTGSVSPRRRALTALAYAGSLVFYTLVLATSFIVADVAELPNAFYLTAGPLFIAFSAFFWSISAASIYNVWRAQQRALTTSTRRRLRMILLVIMAAPLSVFPYIAASGSRSASTVPLWAWLLLIAGNAMVGAMFAQLTANIVYVGGVESSRVMRVRLFKFMARVPMTASIVLLVYVLTIRATNFLGLESQTAAAFTTVASLMLVEWAIHAYKTRLERILHFNNEPDVKRIQELSDRLITRADMNQYLESLLSSGCDVLRVPTAFIASIGREGAQLAAWIGDRDKFLPNGSYDLNVLPTTELIDEADGDLIRWHNYRIEPLYARDERVLVGILGIQVRDNSAEFDPHEELIVKRISNQAANALEDQLLQQSVFAAVEGLLPTLTALQKRRSEVGIAGKQLLEAGDSAELADSPIDSEDFKKMVKDALDHYWGGPKLTDSPLLGLSVVQNEAEAFEGNIVKGLRAILKKAIDLQKPDGEQSLSRTEWLLYNILELKVVQGNKVRPIARRLAMSEADFYRKQRVAIENVARAIAEMERGDSDLPETETISG